MGDAWMSARQDGPTWHSRTPHGWPVRTELRTPGEPLRGRALGSSTWSVPLCFDTRTGIIPVEVEGERRHRIVLASTLAAFGLVVGVDAGRQNADPGGEYRIDLTRYFLTPAAEAQARAAVVHDAEVFSTSKTPSTAEATRQWLAQYDALLESLERHDIY